MANDCDYKVRITGEVEDLRRLHLALECDEIKEKIVYIVKIIVFCLSLVMMSKTGVQNGRFFPPSITLMVTQ